LPVERQAKKPEHQSKRHHFDPRRIAMNENDPFTAHHLRFEVEAITPLLLPAFAGPSLRGALFAALQRHFCPAPPGQNPSAEHKALCPVCWLMATEKPESQRGQDVPRPYTLEPPVTQKSQDEHTLWFNAGQRFTFGLTLFAQALNLFPYVVVAMPILGQAGLGVPLEENATRPGYKRRGQFVLRRVEAVNPLTGEVATVMGEGQTTVQMPDVPVTSQDVTVLSQAMLAQLKSDSQVQIHFHTPTRVVEAKRLVHRPWLGPLFRRLLERLDALRGEFAGQFPFSDREHLIALADHVRLAQDLTHWVEVKSGSRRLERHTWVSGFLGTAAYQADKETWEQLLPYLLWGQVIHVGKNATKGNGWYEIEVSNGG
jgi:hypothetical protein